MAATKSKSKAKSAPARVTQKRVAKPVASAASAARAASKTQTGEKFTTKATPRSDQMNEQFTRQAQDMFRAAQDARIPENVQAMAEEGVAKTREAMQKLQVVAKDNAKVVEDVVLAAQAGAKAIGEKVLHNTTMNTEAVFDAAQAIARARSLPEAARLQADFMQQQMTVAGAQTKELFELSAKFAQQTMESMKVAATRSFDQTKR